ncbi:MAG: MAPEG family protein [Cuspidothrix sp.]
MYLSQLPVHAIFLYSIVVAALLIYVPYLLVAFGRLQIGYDFSAPSGMLDKLPAYSQRATWAHQNSFEGFIVFAPAALMAYVTGVNSPEGVTAAIAFIIARLLYSIFYIANIPLLRSLMFIVATVSSGTLFWLSLMQIK